MADDDDNGNGNGENENKKPDISEMASRWYASAPQEPTETQEPEAPDGDEETDADVVSYYGSGHIYLSADLQKKVGTLGWGSPIHLPAEYDAENERLILDLESVNADGEGEDEDRGEDENDGNDTDRGGDNDTLASDGGGLSDEALAELVDDLLGKLGDSQ